MGKEAGTATPRAAGQTDSELWVHAGVGGGALQAGVAPRMHRLVCACMYVYVHTHMCLHVHTCVHTHVCDCMHTLRLILQMTGKRVQPLPWKEPQWLGRRVEARGLLQGQEP